MKIYHYTNIESLALILKNKTIRFNRLDQVDDVEEGAVESLGVRACKYVFVSCWTEVPEENIPLWKMYGGDAGGVRISMEREMFKEYLITDLNLGNGLRTIGAIWSKIPKHDIENPNYMFIPILNYDNDLFYRHVKYVDDISIYTKDAIQLSNYNNGRADMQAKLKPFGYYKNKRWAFQNETRFVLYAFPCNILKEGNNPEISTIFTNSILTNRLLPFSYYDMCLKDDAFETLEITLSPSATEAQKIIVQSLIEKYAPKSKVHPSSLGSIIRLK